MRDSLVMRRLRRSGLQGALAASAGLFGAATAANAQAGPVAGLDALVAPAMAQDPGQDVPPEAQAGDTAATEPPEAEGAETDIISRNTLSILLDGRIVLANGARSWVDRGLGKTRFDGDGDRDYQLRAVPVEATLIWLPRFTNSLSANVSGGWQRDQEKSLDLIEAFVSFVPPRKGTIGFSARAGLMWPEISLEHSTGGAWSVVNSITPSAINSWIGEEVKVLGAEATIHASLGEHQLAATGGAFGYNDTSGTLLSFRGWALHDAKATAFGYFPLPPLNPFMTRAQEDRTRNLLELDDRVGFYGRLDWRPPWPFGAALFYYDNRGDPEAFNDDLQWGWRTRFWNLGINADLGPSTRLLAQGMTGTTIMGFRTRGERWVRTRFRSAYLLVTHQLSEKLAVTGRVEAFDTRERGSRMSTDESEKGWALTAAARYSLTDQLTLFLEALNNRSRRRVRTNIGLDPFQAQTVFQAGLRFRL